MTRPQDQDRRRESRGRRSTDEWLERDLDELRRAFERLEREVGPVEGQVARVDGTLQAVEATLKSLASWLEDERRERRLHDRDLDAAHVRLRDHVDGEVKTLRELLTVKFAECMAAIGGVGTESRAGRRTIIITIITTAGLIVAAYLQGK